MAYRPKLGVVKKSAPSVSDPALKRVIDTIYRDINSLSDDVHLPSGTHTFLPREGGPGDVRLYEGVGSDGSTGYFMQGRFKDGWGTVQLTLETKNPETVDTQASTDGQVFAGYITIYDVTKQNLAFNDSVGSGSHQVSQGNHSHDHQTLSNLVGEYHALSGDPTGIVKLTATNGTGDTWTRADHGHALDQSIAPEWTGEHNFYNTTTIRGTSGGADWPLAIWPNTQFGRDNFGEGETNDQGMTAKFWGPSTEVDTDEFAIDVTGHVLIDGELTVGVAISDNNDVDFAGNLDVGGYLDVDGIFTQGIVGNNTNDCNIYGEMYTQNIVSIIPHGSAADVPALKVIGISNASHGQLRVGSSESMFFDLKVDTSGNLLVDTIGNIQLLPEVGDDTPGQVLPKQTLLTDLGDFNRMFRSLFVGEIYAETLVAQDVLATIGGRISVAPTTMYETFLGSDPVLHDTIEVRHNIFEKGDYAISKSAPMGLPQTEIFRIADDGEWAYTHITVDTVTALENSVNVDVRDYIAAVESDWGIKPNCRIVCTDGGGTPINFTNNGPGSTQTLEDGSWIKVAGTPGNGFQEPPNQGINGAYKAMIKTADTEDDDTEYTEAPDLEAGEIDIRVPSDVFGTSTTKSYPDLVVYVGPHKYKVARSVAGIGLPNRWQSGDAIMNLGHESGDGFIEITSTETAYQDLGPTITLYGRDDSDGSSGVDLTVTTPGTGYSTGKFTTTPSTGTGSGLEGTIVAVGGSGEITHLAPDVDTANGMSTLGGTGYAVGNFLNVVQTGGSSGIIKVLSIEQNWNGALPVASMGSLRSFVDYNEGDAHGIALGKNLYTSTAASFQGVTIDPVKGVRLFSTPLKMYYNGTDLRYHLESDGKMRVGPALVDDPLGDYSIPDNQQGYSWDGSVLRMSGIINITSGPTFDDIQGNISDLNDVPGNVANLVVSMSAIEAVADGRINAYYEDESGSISGHGFGDYWIDTDQADPSVANSVYRWEDSTGGSQDTLDWRQVDAYDALGTIYFDARNAQITADGKVTTFYQDGIPTSEGIGDLWVDTDDSNKLYRAASAGANEITAGEWVTVQDTHNDSYITSLTNDLSSLTDDFDVLDENTVSDGEIVTTYANDAPVDPAPSYGDWWVKLNIVPMKAYRYEDTNGLNQGDLDWVDRSTNLVGAAYISAVGAQATADGKITTYYGNQVPIGLEGDIWIHTGQNNAMYRAMIDGSDAITVGEWEIVQDLDIQVAVDAASAAQTAAETAQEAIEAMEDQVVLTDNALEIWTVEQGPNYKLAKYGSTSVFYDGIEDESENELLVLGSGGVSIKLANVEIAKYGATTRIGVDADNQSAVRLSNSTLTIGTKAQHTGDLSPIYADANGKLTIRNTAGFSMIDTGSPFTIQSGDVMTDGTTPYTEWNLDDSDTGIIQRQQVEGEAADYHYTELAGGFLSYKIGDSSFNYPRATQWIRASKVNFGGTTTFLTISGDTNIQDMFDGNYNVQYHPVMLPTAKGLPVGRAEDSTSHTDGGSSVIKLNRTIDNTVNFESLNKGAESFQPRMAMYHGPVGGGGGYDANGYSMTEYRTISGSAGSKVISTSTNLRDSFADGDGSIEAGTYNNGTTLFTDHDDDWGSGDVHDLWYPMPSGPNDDYDYGLFGNSSATNKLKIVLWIKMNYNYLDTGIGVGDYGAVSARVMIRFGKKRWDEDDFYSDHYAFMGHGNASTNNTALAWNGPDNNLLQTAVSSANTSYPYAGHTLETSDPYELILEPRTHADIEHNFIDERWGLAVRAFGREVVETGLSVTGYSYGIYSVSWGEDPVKTYEYSGTGFASAFLVDAGQYNTSSGTDSGYPNPFN